VSQRREAERQRQRGREAEAARQSQRQRGREAERQRERERQRQRQQLTRHLADGLAKEDSGGGGSGQMAADAWEQGVSELCGAESKQRGRKVQRVTKTEARQAG
jgi:hypothetical protein